MFDSHAHLGDDCLFTQIDDVITRARDAGVSRIITISTNPTTLEWGQQLSANYPDIYCAGSTRPHDAEARGDADFEVFDKAAREGTLIAIGETGLDYHYYSSSAEIQRCYLIKYLHLALELNLPVIIHCREAFQDLFSILDREYRTPDGGYGPGILHCFTGTSEEVRELVQKGWYVSFSGILTFQKSAALRQAASIVPLDQLLVETDAPYLAPRKHRGKKNEPAFLSETVSCLAELKQITPPQCAEITFLNANRVFGIS